MQVFSPLKRVRSCAWAARGFCFVRSINSLLWHLRHSSDEADALTQTVDVEAPR